MIKECSNKVAIWLAKMNNYDDLHTYTERVWDENGEAEDSIFAKDFDLFYFDIDDCEFDLIQSFDSSTVFKEVSYWDVFLQKTELISKLNEFNLKEFGSFMFIYDNEYSGLVKLSKQAVFIGNFIYKN